MLRSGSLPFSKHPRAGHTGRFTAAPCAPVGRRAAALRRASRMPRRVGFASGQEGILCGCAPRRAGAGSAVGVRACRFVLVVAVALAAVQPGVAADAGRGGCFVSCATALLCGRGATASARLNATVTRRLSGRERGREPWSACCSDIAAPTRRRSLRNGLLHVSAWVRGGRGRFLARLARVTRRCRRQRARRFCFTCAFVFVCFVAWLCLKPTAPERQPLARPPRSWSPARGGMLDREEAPPVVLGRGAVCFQALALVALAGAQRQPSVAGDSGPSGIAWRVRFCFIAWSGRCSVSPLHLNANRYPPPSWCQKGASRWRGAFSM